MKLLARIYVMCLVKTSQDYHSNLAASADLFLFGEIFFRFCGQSIEILMRATVLLKVISQTVTALVLIRGS